jgi:hypothetical protein
MHLSRLLRESNIGTRIENFRLRGVVFDSEVRFGTIHAESGAEIMSFLSSLLFLFLLQLIKFDGDLRLTPEHLAHYTCAIIVQKFLSRCRRGKFSLIICDF